MRIENRGTDAVSVVKGAQVRRAGIRRGEKSEEAPQARADSMEITEQGRVDVAEGARVRPPLEGLPSREHTPSSAQAFTQYVADTIRDEPQAVRVHGLDVKRVQSLI